MIDYNQIFEFGFDIDYVAEYFQIQEPSETTMDKCAHSKTKLMIDVGGSYCVDCGKEFIECDHLDVTKDDSGMDICANCGVEINDLDYSKEWRHFGVFDNKSNKDPSRCHKTKTKAKGISSAFNSESIEIPPALLGIVQFKYDHILRVTKSKVVIEGERKALIVRGDKRKALIAACLFYSYKLIGEDRPSCYIREQLGIKQKKMSEGVIEYLKTFPEDRNLEIRPKDLIKWLMRLTNVNVIHYRRIVALTEQLESASVILKRSTPQALAASAIYFYQILFPNCRSEALTTKNQFAEATYLSDMTIIKLIVEMGRVTGINIKQKQPHN